MPYRIKSNLDVNGRNWGLEFTHGEAFTERDDLARRLRSLGYLVEEVPQSTAKPPETPSVPEAPAPELSAPETLTTESGKLTCPICGKVCGSQAVLTRHTNKDHK